VKHFPYAALGEAVAWAAGPARPAAGAPATQTPRAPR
jgi:hypothetical protein